MPWATWLGSELTGPIATQTGALAGKPLTATWTSVPDGPLAGEIVTAGSDVSTVACGVTGLGNGSRVGVDNCKGDSIWISMFSDEGGMHPPRTSTLKVSANVKADSLFFISILLRLTSVSPG
jgi:hypothetical protein